MLLKNQRLRWVNAFEKSHLESTFIADKDAFVNSVWLLDNIRPLVKFKLLKPGLTSLECTNLNKA
ncbi:MAG: hypothetical protein HW415_143 [Deltaproteobacteria bacterium]|nr:hypothetical protein [Deltaproteobacteria bacterium]